MATNWRTLTDEGLRGAIREIIRTSSGKDEALRRIKTELGYPYTVSLDVHLPTDDVGFSARAIVSGLGGLVMQDGAMAMAMFWSRGGEIISV